MYGKKFKCSKYYINWRGKIYNGGQNIDSADGISQKKFLKLFCTCIKKVFYFKNAIYRIINYSFYSNYLSNFIACHSIAVHSYDKNKFRHKMYFFLRFLYNAYYFKSRIIKPAKTTIIKYLDN